jgi:hypothetical protein
MKVGIELQIDVTKIDKARIYEGKKGKYLTMTAFVDLDNKDQYDQNGMITHKKEEGEERAPILGNTKVFWTDGEQQQQTPHSQYQPTPSHQPQQSAPQQFEDDGEIPF